MQQVVGSDDFRRIKQYVAEHDIKLLILDFNGVLDDYYVQKAAFLRDALGAQHEAQLPALLLAIERAYIADRTATIEQSFVNFFVAQNLLLTETQRDKLANYMFTSRLTSDAAAFLDSLEVPYIIYTSLSAEQAQQSIDTNRYAVFTRDQYDEPKPSITNLQSLLARYDVSAHEACVVGDGLIDDLMPAALLGMHTLLVSPYAEELIRPTKA